MSSLYRPLEILSMVCIMELKDLNAIGSQKSRLEKLPTELRLMIYKLVLLVPDRKIMICSTKKDKRDKSALMCVSKEINAECKPIFWSMNHFLVGNPAGKAPSYEETDMHGLGLFMMYVPLTSMALIATVTFEMNLNYGLDQNMPGIGLLGDAFPATSYDMQVIEHTTTILMRYFKGMTQLTLRCRLREPHDRIRKASSLTGTMLNVQRKIDLINDTYGRLLVHPSVQQVAIALLCDPENAAENLDPILSKWRSWTWAIEGDLLILKKI